MQYKNDQTALYVDCLAVWRATMVHRWHANPDLAGSGDTTGGHQGRVALLVTVLFPDFTKSLMVEALRHDLGEVGVGDASADAKREFPELKAALDRAEGATTARMGLAPISLHEIDRRRLKLVDRLDAFLWMRFRRPDLESRADWQQDLAFLQAEGDALGVNSNCGGVL